jgi:hypothetical protein
MSDPSTDLESVSPSPILTKDISAEGTNCMRGLVSTSGAFTTSVGEF